MCAHALRAPATRLDLVGPARPVEPVSGPVDLLATPERAAELKAQAADWPSWALTPRQQGELELLVSGAFAPLSFYASSVELDSILARAQLPDGTPWPLPISLDVPSDVADAAEVAGHLALRDPEGVLLAVVAVTERFRPDRARQLEALYATTDPDDPGVAWWTRQTHDDRLAGPVRGIEVATHWSFPDLRATPARTRAQLGTDRGARPVGLATAEPLHRSEVRQAIAVLAGEGMVDSVPDPGDPPGVRTEATAVGADDTAGDDVGDPGSRLLVLGLVGPGPGRPLDPHLLVRCWRSALAHLPGDPVLAVSPLPTYGAAARDQQLRQIVLANHGVVELLGVDPGPDDLSPAALRACLESGDAFPAAFTYPDVEAELRRRYPPRRDRGLTLFLTGFSGSGKSTVAQALAARLADRDPRAVTLLDGDRVRHHLSSELGFSRAHRDLNIRRIGFVAAEITRAGGIAICAPIAPYDEVRRDVRAMVSEAGSFVLIHVSTPLEVCEARDRKGLYAQARAGTIREFTGISDPYEVPDDAELTLDTTDLSVDEAVDRILSALEASGHLGPAPV